MSDSRGQRGAHPRMLGDHGVGEGPAVIVRVVVVVVVGYPAVRVWGRVAVLLKALYRAAGLGRDGWCGTGSWLIWTVGSHRAVLMH